VLGLVIEAVSGQDYYDYIREHVYQPAGMEHSDHYTKGESASGKANGYYVPREPGATELESNARFRGNIGSPAGGGYASANDLLDFANALYDGTLIDAKHREEMTTAKVSERPEKGGYAYLYGDGRINGKRYVGHNGGAPGINAQLSIFVRDYGSGVDESELENIFERLYRVDTSRTNSGVKAEAEGDRHISSGLGLAITRELAHLLGGKVIASLPEGGGMQFEITLG
jgi:CubicO group peptidase (beta-lactamase class C family)